MSIARRSLAFALLTSCASTVTGTNGDAALDTSAMDVPSSDGPPVLDAVADQPGDAGPVDLQCPQRPCRTVPLLRASEGATWLVAPDGRTFWWGSRNVEPTPVSSGVVRQNTPTPGPRLSDDVLDFAAGAHHQCVLAARPRRAICWGHNGEGQLGRGTFSGLEEPGVVPGLGEVEAIAAFGDASWALTRAGSFFWGFPTLPGARERAPSPLQMAAAPGRATRFATGESYDGWGYLTSDGEVFAFGGNRDGAAGSDQEAPVSVPTRVAGLADVIDYATGPQARSCAVVASGAVYCWGQRSYLVSFTSDPSATSVPERVVGIDDAVQIRLGAYRACALTRTRVVRCWGAVHWDQATGVRISPPGPAYDLPPVREIALGEDHICALTMDGEVYCWGGNIRGQLGIDGLFQDSTLPRRVTLPL